MPSYPLPSGDSPLGGGDLPVSSSADVLAEFPRPHKNKSVAPVRDGFCTGFAESFKRYQLDAEYAAAQSDPLRATGDYLRSIAEEKQIHPLPDESEESIRARLFTAPSIVTPNAITAAINSLLAPYSDVLAQICEPELDGWFVHDGVSVWDSFVGSTPRYLDRLYIDDASDNGGIYIPQNLPEHAIVSDGTPRTFLIRIPSLGAAEEFFAFADMMFIGDGTDASGTESDGTVATSVFENSLTEEEIYNAIIGTVQTIKGQGRAWILIVDPLLT